jgi:GMP synthase-like glutamine amidotransferase
VVCHHDIDDAGFIADAFVARGAELVRHLVPDDGLLPDLTDVDHIVVLGAVWSVYDEAAIGHWVGDELAWLRKADEAGVPVLGICFGAQALSTALGGRAAPASRQEIGWTVIDSADPELIPAGPWMEFHGDQCLPPSDARILARNEVGVQAFALRRNLAVQFHPEVSGALLTKWMDQGGREQAEREGLDADKLIAETTAEEAAAAQRADRLVATALRLAQEAGTAAV